MTSDLQIFASTGCTLGEGPVWHPLLRLLTLVDVKERKVLVFDDAGRQQKAVDFPVPVSACLPAVSGQFVCLLKTGPVLIDLMGCGDKVSSADCRDLPNPEANVAGNRFNDGKIGPDGAMWFGSMDDAEVDASGHLYRMGPDLRVTKPDGPYVVTNGPAFCPSGTVAYHTDTFGRLVYAFDLLPDGQLVNKRVHIRIPDDAGYPDGMTTDHDGNLWICHFGGGRISRYSPNGTWLEDIAMPVSNVTSCTFGGAHMSDLFITTAKWTLSADGLRNEPMAGHTFRLKTSTRGTLTPLFQPVMPKPDRSRSKEPSV